MKILLVEDTEEQIQLALAAIHSHFPGTRLLQNSLGWEAYCQKTKEKEPACKIDIQRDMQSFRLRYENYDLILTDLMIPNQPGDTPMPNGLSVIIRALRAGCITGLVTETNHHQCSFLQDVLTLLPIGQQTLFFSNTEKNWELVVTEVFRKRRR